MFLYRTLTVIGFLLAFTFEARSAPLDLDCILRGSCIDTQGVVNHLQKLQDIADANQGNRGAGTTGHELSGNYVAQQLLAAGFKVELQPFSFMKFTKLSAAFSKVAPDSVVYVEDKDYQVMSYSGAGVLEGAIQAVDVVLGPGNQSTSGCEVEDFANFTAGNIAVIQRGTCPFQQKVVNAQAAGASAVVLFNQGNTPDREPLFTGTLSDSVLIRIPVLATSYSLAADLLALQGVALQMDVSTKVEKKISFNVIAETKSGNPDSIVMIGAHLDSVAEGPGINDNGSGSASILEVALGMKDIKPINKVRFAWFSAEELGLIGSTKYVEALTEAEKNKIALFINIDMVGSPNYKIGVYDGDGSKFGQAGPKGSDTIERKFHNFFSTTGIQSVETELNGRSDYAAFSAAGIAVGGLFTGAEGVKTAEEAALFGGIAGEAYDVCYHKACDSINNINNDALEANTSAVAYLLLSFADSTLEVRSADKLTTPREREKVVFPKHLHCHEDVHDI